MAPRNRAIVEEENNRAQNSKAAYTATAERKIAEEASNKKNIDQSIIML